MLLLGDCKGKLKYVSQMKSGLKCQGNDRSMVNIEAGTTESGISD